MKKSYEFWVLDENTKKYSKQMFSIGDKFEIQFINGFYITKTTGELMKNGDILSPYCIFLKGDGCSIISQYSSEI